MAYGKGAFSASIISGDQIPGAPVSLVFVGYALCKDGISFSHHWYFKPFRHVSGGRAVFAEGAFWRFCESSLCIQSDFYLFLC